MGKSGKTIGHGSDQSDQSVEWKKKVAHIAVLKRPQDSELKELAHRLEAAISELRQRSERSGIATAVGMQIGELCERLNSSKTENSRLQKELRMRAATLDAL